MSRLDKYFSYDHLREPQRAASAKFANLREELMQDLGECVVDWPEFNEGMRKLLEAKDCVVRSTLADQ